MSAADKVVDVRRVGWNFYTWILSDGARTRVGSGTRSAAKFAIRRWLLDCGGKDF